MKVLFRHLVLIALVVVIAACGGAPDNSSGGGSGGSGGGSGGSGTAPSGEEPTGDETPAIGLPFADSAFATDLSKINTVYPYGPPRDETMSAYAAVSWGATEALTVIASADGTISTVSGSSGDYRVLQTIDGYEGWSIQYITLDSVEVSAGESIEKGETIGVLVSGGFNYYPLWWNITYSSIAGYCPMTYLDDEAKAVAKAYLDAWNDFLDENPEQSEPFRCYCYTYGLSQAEALAFTESECEPSLE